MAGRKATAASDNTVLLLANDVLAARKWFESGHRVLCICLRWCARDEMEESVISLDGTWQNDSITIIDSATKFSVSAWPY